MYSGLNAVKMDKKMIENGYFMTYVSTSWSKYIATRFMKKEGMIIHFDKEFKADAYSICCDVSWISKFPDECEVLFARSLPDTWVMNNFSCVVLDESKGIQTIRLKKRWE